jgi:uncharacterized protein (TIGR01777 family)
MLQLYNQGVFMKKDSRMKVFITGGTGFLGAALTEKLLSQGHLVAILSRSSQASDRRSGLRFLKGDPSQKGPWQKEIGSYDVVINLAGASIFRPWSTRNKEAIYNSRILSTRNIIDALAHHSDKEVILLNASAVGYYGFRDDEELDESGPPGDDFLATVVREWEAEAIKAKESGTRVVLCRLGVILGQDGGALAKMLPVFKWGIGSPLGSGKQWFSWISLPDLVNIFLFLMENKTISGPVNCTSPHPVTNREMTRALGKALHRPVILPPVPAFLLKGVLGEFSQVFVKGQKVIPAKLLKNGFVFKFPEIGETLTHILN